MTLIILNSHPVHHHLSALIWMITPSSVFFTYSNIIEGGNELWLAQCCLIKKLFPPSLQFLSFFPLQNWYIDEWLYKLLFLKPPAGVWCSLELVSQKILTDSLVLPQLFIKWIPFTVPNLGEIIGYKITILAKFNKCFHKSVSKRQSFSSLLMYTPQYFFCWIYIHSFFFFFFFEIWQQKCLTLFIIFHIDSV